MLRSLLLTIKIQTSMFDEKANLIISKDIIFQINNRTLLMKNKYTK